MEDSIIPSDDIKRFLALGSEVIDMYNIMEALPGYVQDNSETIGNALPI